MSAATAEPVPAQPALKTEYFQFTNLGPLLFGLLVSGGVAIVICLLVLLIGTPALRERMLHAWLFAFAVCFTISAGSLFWIMVHHASDAEWSVVVRRLLEVAASTFFYLWIFFLPLLLLAPDIYHWMDPSLHDPVIEAKRAMLNRPAWGIRTVSYFIFFGVMAFAFKRFSTRQDATGDPKWTVKSRLATYPFLPFFAIFLTGAVIDWLMSLNAHWYSTMWGVYLFAGAAWSSMACLILVTHLLQKGGYLNGVVTREHYQIMGKLLLSFTVFWAYIAFDQYFLYWYGNIPEEVEYFVRRNTGSWQALSITLVVLHFFVPFLLLLPRASKRLPSRLTRIAIYALCIHLLDIYIIVIPAYDAEGFTLLSFFLSALALVAVAAPLAFLFIRNLGKHALYPIRDPRILQSLKLVN